MKKLINNSKIKNLSIKEKIIAMAIAGTLSTVTLVGCGNRDIINPKQEYNKAIIFNNNTVTIVEIEKWNSIDETFKIYTSEGFSIMTSTSDTKLINDNNSNISAEDFVKSIMGENVTINYLNGESQKTR